jgi:hypothetical protein
MLLRTELDVLHEAAATDQTQVRRCHRPGVDKVSRLLTCVTLRPGIWPAHNFTLHEKRWRYWARTGGVQPGAAIAPVGYESSVWCSASSPTTRATKSRPSCGAAVPRSAATKRTSMAEAWKMGTPGSSRNVHCECAIVCVIVCVSLCVCHCVCVTVCVCRCV